MEQNTRQCTYCDSVKPWIWNGQRLKDGSKIYVNESGTRWAGRRCPDCERKRVRHALSIDDFNRALIIKELESQGFEVVERSLPIKVLRNGKKYRVVIKKAYTDGESIIVDEAISKNEEGEVVVFAFQSIRVLADDHLATIKNRCKVYSP